MWTCRNKQWEGLVEMMALSTVTRNNVYSVYPDASPAMRPLFHGLIKPCIARDVSRTCYIMWSRCSSFDNEGVFQLNHFVSLSEVHVEKKRGKSYTQIIAGKQKGEGESMGGKKTHSLFFERKTPFSSPTSPDKGKEQGNSVDDTNGVQNDPVSSTTSLDKDQEEDFTANEKKVAEQDSFLPTSSPGKGKQQRNSADDTKEVEEDSESSPPKRSKITPSSPTDMSIKMSLLVTPFLCHQKRKFSKVEQSTCTSASLSKHLTVLTSGNPNNPEVDAGTGDKEKQEKGKQGIIEIGTSRNSTSPASHVRKKKRFSLVTFEC